MTHPSRFRITTMLGVLAALALASSASASTLTMSNGTLAYAAAASTTSNIAFTQSASPTDTVTIVRNTASGDNDPITSAPGTCTTADAGVTYVCTGVSAVIADTGDGNDSVGASGLSTISATLTGADGSDSLTGGAAGDTLDGGAGDDNLDGQGGNDSLVGGDGTDSLSGGTGTDTLAGGNGDDLLFLTHNTVTNPGGPAPEQDNGDVVSGGDGLDVVYVNTTTTDQKGTASGADDTTADVPASITLDDTANDGASGQNANVRSDVESVNLTSTGPNTLTGSAGTNQLTGSTGNDTIDPGAGNDVVQAGAGDDTINARDGYADLITCGAGTDTANVDSLDSVAADCETVNRTTVPNANEDRPPTISLTAPADGATVSNKKPMTITASAADDRGVSAVLYTVNGRLVCNATKAPYSCDYQPQGADVGRTAIVAAVVDTSQQIAMAQRTVTIPRFDPHKFTAYVTPGRDLFGPRRFTAKGRLTLPATVAAADGCGHGRVTVQIKAGARTISTRHVGLRKDCTYASTVTFGNARRFGGEFLLRYAIEFGGNATLRHTKVHRYSVQVA